MATYYARKAGNINASDVWATSPTGTAAAQTFVSGDILISNSFAITVNVSTDLGATGEVRNDTTGGATTGGSFALSNGITLTANIFAGSVTCVTLASGSATIVGNITGGTSANAYGVGMNSSGTLTITGSVTGGTAASSYGINATTTNSTITITGNITAGTGSAASGVWADAAALSVTVTGNATGGSSANAAGCRVRSSSKLTLTGNSTGGSAAAGVLVEGTGDVNIIGTAIGGSGGAGVQGGSTSAITIVRAKGGSTAGAFVGVSAVTTGSVSVEEIEYGDLGASPTSGPIRLVNKTSNVAVMYIPSSSKKSLVDANASGLMPSVSDVRFGIIYNGGNSTGTCRVPAASGVAFGVLVDNTTGTAALTPASVWDHLISNISTSGSIGDRLKNCATITTVGQQLSDALSE